MFKIIKRCKVGILSLCSVCCLGTQLSAVSPTEQKHSENKVKNYISVAGASNSSKSQTKVCNSWKPYFDKNSNLGTQDNYFANLNAGVGFLRFDQITGSPSLLRATNRLKTSKMQFSPVVNKTPLFEGSVGVNVFSWMGLGLSFLNQSNIYFQSYILDRSFQANTSLFIFSANIDLNAVVGKMYFYLPYSMVWKSIAYNPYLGISVGPSWQTWKNITLNIRTTNLTTAFTQKVSANCFFGSEFGLQLRSLAPGLNLSLLMGCKFNIWGQARSMGKANQQKQRNSAGFTGNSANYAFTQPWRIKTVYQWAPYLGLVWSY